MWFLVYQLNIRYHKNKSIISIIVSCIQQHRWGSTSIKHLIELMLNSPKILRATIWQIGLNTIFRIFLTLIGLNCCRHVWCIIYSNYLPTDEPNTRALLQCSMYKKNLVSSVLSHLAKGHIWNKDFLCFTWIVGKTIFNTFIKKNNLQHTLKIRSCLTV